jgi:SAM-dependent methyltransferase
MEKNLATYTSDPVVSWYEKLDELIPVEKKIFSTYKELLVNARLLDIGIGGGRTTKNLIGLCKHYTGIDYSERFVNSVKKRFPYQEILHADARDLSRFQSCSFDFVNFSFNGMDYVDAEDRIKILAQICNVLKPGGVFFFSTHNRRHKSFNQPPWRDKKAGSFINIKTLLKLLPFYWRKISNRRFETLKNEFAIINDPAHNYSLMTFYTTPEYIEEQLLKAGFGNIEMFDKIGNKPGYEHLDDWIFITCTKC